MPGPAHLRVGAAAAFRGEHLNRFAARGGGVNKRTLVVLIHVLPETARRCFLFVMISTTDLPSLACITTRSPLPAMVTSPWARSFPRTVKCGPLAETVTARITIRSETARPKVPKQAARGKFRRAAYSARR